MIEKGTFQFLGTGASMGVPVIGCACEVCQSTEPHNKRLRPSALLEVNGKRLLIDCGPDFKEQALRIGLNSLDGVIFTHSHNDHIAGIDDLRTLCKFGTKGLPCLLSQITAEDIQQRFSYIFETESVPGKFTTRFDVQLLEKNRGETFFQGLHVNYVTYEQMHMPVNGFRFGNLAYLTDVHKYSDKIFESLQTIDTLVISSLRYTPSPMHLSVDEAIDFSRRTGASKVYLMHISHDLDHEKTNAYLPENIRMAYDGLRLDFQVDIKIENS